MSALALPIFFFKQRLPFGMMRSGVLPWLSTMATNAGIAALAVLLIWAVGIVPFLLIHRQSFCLPDRLVSGCSMFSTISKTPLVQASEWTFPIRHAGACIMICRTRCDGSPPISGVHRVTTIYRAECRFTGCRKCCVTVRSWRKLGRVQHSWTASAA